MDRLLSKGPPRRGHDGPEVVEEAGLACGAYRPDLHPP